MPKFDSPIGSKQFRGQQMREFNVPDEGGFEQPPVPPMRRPVHDNTVPQFDERSMQEFQAQMQPTPGAVREMSDVERQILAAKKAKREGKERLSDGARRRIEMLLEMTRMTRTVEIASTSFTLQVLKAREVREALEASAPYDGTVFFAFESAKQTLARSMTQIAGTDIQHFLNSEDLEDRLIFVEEMPQPLFTRLYDEYVNLDNESKEKFALKSENEVKEVLEDLKK